MSLLNKIINESLLQDKLNSELADISYRAVNGKRQKARNFSEGMLNVGTINFNTPKSQITKDMILDYQDEQQKKHYEDTAGNKLQYFPSEVTDALTVYTPIQLASLGREVTEQDINIEKQNLYKIHDDLNQQYKDIKMKEREKSNLEYDLAITEENIIKYTNFITKAENRINEITPILTDIANILKKPANSRTDEEKKKVSEKSKLEKEEKELQTKKTRATQLETDAQIKKIQIENEIPKVEGEIQKLIADIPNIEKAIEKKDTEIEQLKENYEENRVEQLKVKNVNKPIVKKYEEAFNIANRNRYQVQQDPHESDQDFLNRIQSLEQLPFDENIFKDKAAVEESRKLMKNLKQVLRDDVKISEIVRSFPQPEDVYEVNKYFKKISKRLLNIFGFDNKNVKFNDYVDEIKRTIEILQSAPEEDFIVNDAPAVPTVSPAPTAATPLLHKDGSQSDFEYKIVDNSLYIKNTANGKHIYIKIGRRERNLIFFSSTTNNQGNFTFFSFRGSSSNTWSYVMMHVMQLLTDTNEDIYDQLFGDTTKSDEIFDFIKTTHGLTEIEGIKKVVHATSGVNRALTFGWGMKHDEIPKYCKFGKNILLLNKLYYKNILSVKDSNMHAIEHFPNVHVSETLVKIIFDMCKNTQPTKVILDTLTASEKELLDMLLYVSGLHKNIHNKKNEHVIKLKDRLKLVESEIRAGNNNPVLKSELKDLIHKLHLFGVVSLYNANNYLKQF